MIKNARMYRSGERVPVEIVKKKYRLSKGRKDIFRDYYNFTTNANVYVENNTIISY